MTMQVKKMRTELEESIATIGGQPKIWTSDNTTAQLLEAVLYELKKIKLHLRAMTDEEFIEGDD